MKNKDLEQLEEVINSLINCVKKLEVTVVENGEHFNSSIKVLDNTNLRTAVIKSQNELIHGVNDLKNKISSVEIIPSHLVSFKNDVQQTLDDRLNALEKVTVKHSKPGVFRRNISWISTLILVIASTVVITKQINISKQRMKDALKYQHILKQAQLNKKKEFLKLDSVNNELSIDELEEQFKKTEGK